MAKTKKPNGKLDLRIIFEEPLSGNIRKDSDEQHRKHHEQVRYIVDQYYQNRE